MFTRERPARPEQGIVGHDEGQGLLLLPRRGGAVGKLQGEEREEGRRWSRGDVVHDRGLNSAERSERNSSCRYDSRVPEDSHRCFELTH